MGGWDKSSGYDYHKIRHQEILTLDDAAAVQHIFVVYAHLMTVTAILSLYDN